MVLRLRDNGGATTGYKKNPIRFNFYKFSCGRARRLAELWGEK